MGQKIFRFYKTGTMLRRIPQLCQLSRIRQRDVKQSGADIHHTNSIEVEFTKKYSSVTAVKNFHGNLNGISGEANTYL